MKELGWLEGQLAGLRQELAALTLKQSSVDQVGLLPQQLQAVRDDVSWNLWVSQGIPSPLRRSWESAGGGVPPCPCSGHRRWLSLMEVLPFLTDNMEVVPLSSMA